MKSWQLADEQATPGLRLVDVPQPRPRGGEILVRVEAAGIITTELGWYPTRHQQDGTARANAVPSHEFSGEIAELAPDVTSVSVGDEVFGMNDWYMDGALAEYCLTRPEWIAPKPRGLSHAEAASVPISALTAWQGLFDRAKLQAGERVLVQGGAGGVGSFAVQLAHWCEAHVVTTVSSRNVSLVRNLGADEVIDYLHESFEQKVRGIDVVLDTVGGKTLAKSWGVLSTGGRVVTVASEGEGTSDERVKAAFFIVEPRHDQLADIAAMIDAGKLRPVVDTVVEWQQAPDTYDLSLTRRGRGKMVVAVADGAGRPASARG